VYDLAAIPGMLANDPRMDHNLSLIPGALISLFPERKWSIQTEESARITFTSPGDEECSSAPAWYHPGKPIGVQFRAQ